MRGYFQAVAKSSLKEKLPFLRDAASKFGLSFRKFNCFIVFQDNDNKISV